MSGSSTAAYAAKKGMGMLFNATKTGIAAISMGINMVRKGYANKHETGVLDDLRKQGKTPADHAFEAFRRVWYLYLAGYKNEIAAAGRYSGKRLTFAETSSVPLDAVLVMTRALMNEAKKYGDFEKNIFSRSLQDYRNKSKMGKDHYDRDSVIHDVYYSLLYATEECGSDWHVLEEIYREVVNRVVAHALNTMDRTLPGENPEDRKQRAAKTMYRFATEMKTYADDCERERERAVKEAEEKMKQEEDRLKKATAFAGTNAGAPSPQGM